MAEGSAAPVGPLPAGPPTRPTAQALLALGAVGGLGVLLYLARDALAPYLLGLLLAYLLLPVVRWVEARLPDRGRWAGARRPVAAVVTSIASLTLILVLLGLLLDPVIDQTSDLFANLSAYWQRLLAENDGFRDWYETAVPEQLQGWIDENIAGLERAVLTGAAGVVEWTLNATGSLVSAGLALVAVPLFVVYYLMDEPSTARTLRRRFPAPWAEEAVAAYRIADRILGSYTRGVVLEAAIVGAITGVGYWLIGVELALPLAVIAFAGEVVPIIGPWIAFAISFPVVLATQPDRALLAVALFGVIQAIEGWVLAPRIQGGSVEFTSVGTLLVLAIGGAIGGALGIVVALPAAAVLRAAVLYAYHRLDGATPPEALARLRLPGTEDRGAPPETAADGPAAGPAGG